MQRPRHRPDSLNQAPRGEAPQRVFQQAFRLRDARPSSTPTANKCQRHTALWGTCPAGVRGTNLAAGSPQRSWRKKPSMRVAWLIRQKHSRGGSAFFRSRRIERKLAFAAHCWKEYLLWSLTGPNGNAGPTADWPPTAGGEKLEALPLSKGQLSRQRPVGLRGDLTTYDP